MAINLFGQNDLDLSLDGEGRIAQRVRSMKIAFITDKLQLTPEQSQNFWPIYNAFEARQRKIKRESGDSRSIESLSDKEVEQLIEKRFDTEQALLDAKRTYFEELKKVISIRQIAILPKAERQFKTFLLKEMQKRRKR